MKRSKFIVYFLVGIVVLLSSAFGCYIFYKIKENPKEMVVSNFVECAALGNPIMESYPRQCRYKDKNFIEDVGNVLDKIDLIQLETPQPNVSISSPLEIKGQARGTWFFEGSFPVVLVDWDGRIISQGIAQAKGEWMTTEFVPFTATLEFIKPDTSASNRGSLILRKDNPSGLPANDDALEIPVVFK